MATIEMIARVAELTPSSSATRERVEALIS